MARDIYHDAVKTAMIRDGWTITDDPYVLPFGRRNLYVDLGAEKLLAAEKQGTRVVVEIKSFLGHSEVEDLEQAVGQYTIYRTLLQRVDPERELYLAVPVDAFRGIFSEPVGQVVREDQRIKVIVFDPAQEVIQQWLGQ